MKKLAILICFFLQGLLTVTNAQGLPTFESPNEEQWLVEARKTDKPALISKAKLTDAEAEKVLAIDIWAMRMGQLSSSGINDTAFTRKMMDKKIDKYRNIPLSVRQITAVINYYEEKRKHLL